MVNQEKPTAKAVGFLLCDVWLERPVESPDSAGVPGSPRSPFRAAPLGDRVGSVPGGVDSPFLLAGEWAGLTQRSHLVGGRDGNGAGYRHLGQRTSSERACFLSLVARILAPMSERNSNARRLYGRPWAEHEYLLVLDGYISNKNKQRGINSEFGLNTSYRDCLAKLVTWPEVAMFESCRSPPTIPRKSAA